MKRSHVACGIIGLTGIGLFVAATGCATTSAQSLAAAQGGEDVTHVCEGIPVKERELGLLSYRHAIGGTAPLRDRVQISKGMIVDQDVGVQIAVRAEPGLTAPWLERVASCHVALAAAGQLEAANAKNDPLLVRGVTVAVDQSATGFVVSVRAPSASAATDVNARAVALISIPEAPMVARAK